MKPYTDEGPVDCDVDFETSNAKGKTVIVTGGVYSLPGGDFGYLLIRCCCRIQRHWRGLRSVVDKGRVRLGSVHISGWNKNILTTM
jgi:hypothetical protein